MLTEVALVVGLVLLAAGLWRRGGARFGWATAVLGALIVAATLLLSARTRAETRRRQDAAAGAANPDIANRVVATADARRLALTPADLAHLRWIEGTWRGAGSGQAPFYERYRFADDSTLLVESFADSTLGRVTDVTRFALRGGTLASAPNEPKPNAARWVASRFEPDRSVAFAPLEHARNSFTWRRDSADAWTATLEWPATPGDAAARRRVYEMRRWK